jgi:hypothetical protein
LSLDLDPLILGFFHYISFNFTNVAIAIIASFLNDRSFHVSISEINSGTDPIRYGVLQEAILSQYLYTHLCQCVKFASMNKTITFYLHSNENIGFVHEKLIFFILHCNSLLNWKSKFVTRELWSPYSVH